MRIFVNDTPKEVVDGASVVDVVASLGLESGDGIAVALNQEVIYKPDWPKTFLQQNDMILIIRATKGG